jgi:GT2 family glycosyltransferase
MRSITAVIVTYNRLSMLKNLLEHLDNQSYPLTDVIIVNNNSNDGTREYLSDLEGQYVVLNLDKNLGSAGGFAEGLKKAYSTGSEFIWVLDDDGVPNLDALEKLMTTVDGVLTHYAACNLVTSDNEYLIGNPADFNFRRILAHPGGPFNGILLSRLLLKEVGVPMNSFFIWGEEYEFLNRIQEAGFLTFTVLDAILVHKSTKIDYRTNKRLPMYVRNLVFQFRLKKSGGKSYFVLLLAVIFRIIRLQLKVLQYFRIGTFFRTCSAVYYGFMKKNLLQEYLEARSIFK